MKITPNLLASFVNGEVEGDGEIEISGFSKIEEAKKGHITFIANPQYAHFINTTEASVVLVSKDFKPEGEYQATLLRVADPYSALAELLTAFENVKPKKVGIEQPCFISDGINIPEDAYIGAFSYIGKNVKLGNGVKIYPQVYIGDDVVLGDNTILRPGVKVYEGCKIGKRCILHGGVVIGGDGFGFAPKDGKYEKIPQIGIVIIEDDVEIGANTTIDRATFGCTKIGRGTKLDNLIQVAHNVELGEDNVIAAQTGIAGSTKIGNSNRIGGQVGFAGHIKVGDYNEIGAQSGIPSGIGDKKRIIGYPAIEYRDFFRREIYLRQLGEIVKDFNKNKSN
ncbi:MAG: UDP-3-O-(3-hydroxymyristoyl)glucosamine N-acyltransferase [Muribaculaceae bacterium]|nr:UDP-3-O-(3-hydroxymyristoyl)glucosamine N-acyltransferase [Muribaculaceae bacterium]